MKAWVLFERVEERNLDFVSRYRTAAADSVARYDGRYLTVSFINPVLEGPDIGPGPRMIGIKEFTSRAAAERWFDSEEYRKAREIRLEGSTNRTMIIDVSPPTYEHTTPAASATTTKRQGAEPADPAWVIFERYEERNLDFVPEYRQVASASVAMFGGRYKTVSFDNRIVEGPGKDSRLGLISIIEFASRGQAAAWYASPEYAAAIELRRQGVSNRAMIVDVMPPRYAAEAVDAIR